MAITKGQQHLLKLLKEFDTICKENGLRYFAAGGTMIGVLRHRGFLPWDDDADVYMTRDEFAKLVEIARNGGLPEGRHLSCQELDRGYTNTFGRYVDATSSAIHRSQMVDEDVAGEVIDVFQLDPVPSDPEYLERHFMLLVIYSDLINENAVYFQRTEYPREEYLWYVDYAREHGKAAALELIEEELFRHNEEECELYFQRWGGAPLVMPQAWFAEAEHYDLEGVDIPVPPNFNEYLSYHYSDEWEQVPNITEQVSHDVVHSFDHDYKLIKRGYLDAIDPEGLRQLNLKFKQSRIENSPMRHEISDIALSLRAAKVRRELVEGIEARGIDVVRLYDDGEYIKLAQIFRFYYHMQNSAQFAGRDTYEAVYRWRNPILFDLPEPLLEIALLAQMDSGRPSKSARVIDIYEKVRGSIPPNLEAIRAGTSKMREAKNQFYLGKLKQSLTIATEVLGTYPRNSDMLKMAIRCRIGLGLPHTETWNLVNRGLLYFPDDGDFLKFKADLVAQADSSEALELYLEARNHTSHGMTLLEISDILEFELAAILMNLREAYSSGDLGSALKLKELALRISDTAPTQIQCLEAELEAALSLDRAYQVFLSACRLVGAEDSDGLGLLLRRALERCGQSPRVAMLHSAILLGEAGIEQARAELERVRREGFQVLVPEFRYCLGEALLREGDIAGAYTEFKSVVFEVDESSVVRREIVRLIREDEATFAALNMLNSAFRERNMAVKYGSAQAYEVLCAKLLPETNGLVGRSS